MDDDKQVSQAANAIGNILTKSKGFTQEKIQILLNVTTKLLQNENWRFRSIGVADTIGYLNQDWDLFKKFDLSLLIKMLYDPEIETRNLAGINFKIIFTQLNPQEIQKMAEEFKKSSDSVKKKLNEGNNKVILHGSILGLIAIVRAHGIEIKPWIPDIMSYLSKFRNNYGATSDAVRLCFSDFWKYHKKIWEHEKMKFTEELQSEISEHINPYNYFA